MKAHTLALAASLAAVTSTLAQVYDVTDLGTLGGPAQAWAINGSGAVVGVSPRSGDDMFRGVLFGASLTAIRPVQGDTQTFARAIGDDGIAYALSFRSGGFGEHAVYLDNGFAGELPAFAPRGARGPYVVGSRELADAAGWRFRRACVLTGGPAGTLADLPSLGGAWSEAMGVNQQGWIVGHSFTLTGLRPRACVWIGGIARDLGTLGGASASAMCVSDSGFVAGVSDTVSGMPHAFRYTLDQNGNVITRADLGALGPGVRAFSHAHGVNDAGDVVGTSDGRAFLFRDGVMHDLNELIRADAGWQLRGATAINAAGRIVGWGVHHGTPAAFLLAPIGACDPDYDQNGVADQDDVAYLINVIAGGDNPTQRDPDFDATGVADQDDVAALVDTIAGGPCP